MMIKNVRTKKSIKFVQRNIVNFSYKLKTNMKTVGKKQHLSKDCLHQTDVGGTKPLWAVTPQGRWFCVI